jgi:hypothetical protein
MFNAYMTDQVVLVQKTGDISWGERAEKETTVRARVDFKNRMVRDFRGEQVVSAATVTMQDRPLEAYDRIKIDGVEHPILSLQKHRAFSKNKILEVNVG